MDIKRKEEEYQDYPVLSLKERDRRWALVRGMLKEKGLDCLIVAGLMGRDEWDGYFSNEGANHGYIVFPLEGEPVCLPWYHGRVIRNMENVQAGRESWIAKWRSGATGAELVAALRDAGVESGNIGVVGLGSRGTRQLEGYIPYKSWAYVLENLPKATFVDVSEELGKLVLVKSDEELMLVRYAAHIGEKACEALLDATKPGVSESELYGIIMYTVLRNGGGMREPLLIMRTGVGSITWSRPMWTYQAQRPRAVQSGELVMTEIFGIYGGLETQQQMCIGLKPVPSVYQECAQVARQTYEAGLRTLRPGKTFQEVVNAMESTIAEAGCWHTSPLIHSVTPQACMGPTDVGMDKALPDLYKAVKGDRTFFPTGIGLDVVIKPGMVFELEPNACKGWNRVNLGGTLIVTEDGVEELNKLPVEMRVK